MKNPYYVAIASIVGIIAFLGFYLSLGRLKIIADALISLSNPKNVMNQPSGNLSILTAPMNIPIINQIPYLNTAPGFMWDIGFSIVTLLIFISALIFLIDIFLIENVR
jgi:hypothetical protein